jgi:LPXTG-site transpeptidase (sortase) family protein
MTTKRKRAKYLRIGISGLLVLAVVALLLLWRVSARDESDGSSGVGANAVAAAVSPLPTAGTPTPTVVASQATPSRIVIPSIGVDAPISVKSMGPDGAMEPPNGPTDVAWYGFTSRPGAGGNAVFSAHVDYRNYGPAVFARLKDLKKGDLVEVSLADGTVYRYQVVLSLSYPAESAPVEEIVGPTSREVITMITCTGTFDEASRQYSHRLVVRAERV